jgi:putative ATP-binding cassette transporter
VNASDLTLPAGLSTLVVGPSGSGKSTLFRALAGIWPFGKGKVATPEGQHMLLLPQRPYLPQGSLRAVLSYPAEPDAFSDAEIQAAMEKVKLGHLTDRLDEVDLWGQRLSGGEQQRPRGRPARCWPSPTGSSSTRRPPRSTRRSRMRSMR